MGHCDMMDVVSSFSLGYFLISLSLANIFATCYILEQFIKRLPLWKILACIYCSIWVVYFVFNHVHRQQCIL